MLKECFDKIKAVLIVIALFIFITGVTLVLWYLRWVIFFWIQAHKLF